MKKPKMKATTLRRTMTVALIIVISISAIGFYYIQGKLNTFAVSVGKTVSESTIGGTNTTGVAKLQEEIAEVQVSATKSKNLVTSSQDYQTQMIKDLNIYAANTGISINDYNFSKSAGATNSVPQPGGIGSNFITITLNNPIPYNNLMQFLKSIESNIPKMQVSSISIAVAPNSLNAVSVQPLTIETYTR